MKDCPSCQAKPEIYKSPGIRYFHKPECTLGTVYVSYSKWGYVDVSSCDKCGTNFTLKTFANNSDSHTLECPICWVNQEAVNGN